MRIAEFRLTILIALSALRILGQTLDFTKLPAPSGSPSARLDGTVVYDPVGQQVFLFGGQDSKALNDLWTYSLKRGEWAQMNPPGPLPPARFGQTLVFDSVRRRLILFGGQSSGFFSDVWAFTIASGTWQQLSPDNAGPTRRYGHSAIYETVRDRMIISHGFTSAGRFDDTWAFDLVNNSWRDLSPLTNRPLPRCLHHAAYDAAGGKMYLYGGCSSGYGPCPQGDLWSFDTATSKWTDLTPKTGPSPRSHYGTAFDTERGVIVIFGGSGNGLLNDTWEYSPAAAVWRQTVVSSSPPAARSRHEGVYVAERKAVFFFGGSTSAGSVSELWSLAAAAAPSGPATSAVGTANAFSGESGAVAPGQIVSLYGSGLGPVAAVTGAFDLKTGLLPFQLGGTSVTWNGIPGPLYYADAGQLNLQVPYELSGAKEAGLIVTVQGKASEPITLPVVAARPGLFPLVWNQDGSINSARNPAAAGSIIVLYATGQGVTVPATVTGSWPVNGYPEPAAAVSLKAGGLPAEILFRGQAPGTAGVMQINARLPGAISAPGEVPVIVAVGQSETQAAETQATIKIWIR